MFFMELRSVLGGRRSIRFFAPDRPAERAKIQRILEAMRIASCAVNAHWLRAVVVNRAEIPAATLEALDHAMAADPTIFVMGEGIGVRGGNFTTTLGLYAKYGPERLCDTPICERGFVGLACGAGMTRL